MQVYSQKIDPKNNMPSNANQEPSVGQKAHLSTHRVQSSIPKGGTESTWVYPSPQMFWNALVRKGKVEGAQEDDMDTIIAIHNNMNENTWNQVLAWEKFHMDDTTTDDIKPKLLRFAGKPHDLSPKARLKMIFGHNAPFDRHDWIVDRGGREVRYVIDYYHDESAIQNDQRPKHMQDAVSIQSIRVDVRPAIDTIESIIDRVFKMPFIQYTASSSTTYRELPFFASNDVKLAEKAKIERIKTNWNDITSKCGDYKNRLKICKDDNECMMATIALNQCIAGVVCPTIAKDFAACIDSKQEEKASVAYNNVVKCIEGFEIDTRNMNK